MSLKRVKREGDRKVYQKLKTCVSNMGFRFNTFVRHKHAPFFTPVPGVLAVLWSMFFSFYKVASFPVVKLWSETFSDREIYSEPKMWAKVSRKGGLYESYLKDASLNLHFFSGSQNEISSAFCRTDEEGFCSLQGDKKQAGKESFPYWIRSINLFYEQSSHDILFGDGRGIELDPFFESEAAKNVDWSFQHVAITSLKFDHNDLYYTIVVPSGHLPLGLFSPIYVFLSSKDEPIKTSAHGMELESGSADFSPEFLRRDRSHEDGEGSKSTFFLHEGWTKIKMRMESLEVKLSFFSEFISQDGSQKGKKRKEHKELSLFAEPAASSVDLPLMMALGSKTKVHFFSVGEKQKLWVEIWNSKRQMFGSYLKLHAGSAEMMLPDLSVESYRMLIASHFSYISKETEKPIPSVMVYPFFVKKTSSDLEAIMSAQPYEKMPPLEELEAQKKHPLAQKKKILDTESIEKKRYQKSLFEAKMIGFFGLIASSISYVFLFVYGYRTGRKQVLLASLERGPFFESFIWPLGIPLFSFFLLGVFLEFFFRAL